MSSALRFSQLPAFFRKYPAFARVFFSDALAQFGHGLLLVAFPQLIYETTGDISLTGLAFAGEIVAYGLLSPFAGYWADRCEQKTMMIGANLARAATLLTLLYVLAIEAPMWVCLILSVLLGATGAFFIPARAAFLRRLLTGEDLLKAVALEGTTGFLLRVLAPATMGLLVGFPATVGVWIDIFLYAASIALLLPGWVTGPRIEPANMDAPGAWREGWRHIMRTPSLRALLGLDLVLSLIGMAAWSSTVAFLSVVLHLPASYNGFLVGATGLAGAIGTRFGTRFGANTRTYLGLLVAVAGTYLVVPQVDTLAGLVAIWLLRGLAIGLFVVLFSQQIARDTPAEKMGRVQAAWDVSACVAAFLGSASTPWLLRYLGPVGSFWLYGLAMGSVALIWFLTASYRRGLSPEGRYRSVEG